MNLRDTYYDVLRYVPDDLVREFSLRLVDARASNINIIEERFLRDEEFAMVAVKRAMAEGRGNAAEYALGNDAIIRECVEKYGIGLELLPESERTQELYARSVARDGLNLYLVPEDLRTHELCMRAIRQNGYAILHVPQRQRTEKMFELAARNFPGVVSELPDRLCTQEYYAKLARINGNILMFIGSKVNDQVCMTALESRKEAYAYLSDAQRQRLSNGLGEKFFLEAVSEGLSLREVPKQYLQQWDICFAAVQHDGLNLKYVPAAHRNAVMCQAALQSNGMAIKYVPSAYQIEAMYYEAACGLKNAKNCVSLEDYPNVSGFLKDVAEKEFLSQRICNIAVHEAPTLMLELPDRFAGAAALKEIVEASKRPSFVVNVIAHRNWVRGEEAQDIYLVGCKRTFDAVLYVPKEYREPVMEHIVEGMRMAVEEPSIEENCGRGMCA